MKIGIKFISLLKDGDSWITNGLGMCSKYFMGFLESGAVWRPKAREWKNVQVRNARAEMRGGQKFYSSSRLSQPNWK